MQFCKFEVVYVGGLLDYFVCRDIQFSKVEYCKIVNKIAGFDTSTFHLQYFIGQFLSFILRIMMHKSQIEYDIPLLRLSTQEWIFEIWKIALVNWGMTRCQRVFSRLLCKSLTSFWHCKTVCTILTTALVRNWLKRYQI